ncbi:ATPase [Micromonospora sp. NBC_01699]|uniref:ATPase n=1 Tax=Micromonospora sp. NBC_01699 TaxID=2975984 RepID=UPI002E31B947|nr:ATPase [Micromonospora sp. NBC_01699]
MDFSIAKMGYDQDQVDSCLADLSERLARLAAPADVAAGPGDELIRVRQEAARLHGMLTGGSAGDRGPARMRELLAVAEQEAAQLLARARGELTAAQEEARQLRDQVYAEAVQARREFEAALHARRLREQQVDHILRDVTVVDAPTDGQEAAPPATAVPATRAMAEEVAADDRPDTVPPAESLNRAQV